MALGNLASWAEGLSDAEAQLLLIRAAKEHTVRFSNPTEIGMEWYKTLKYQGFNHLNPYSRNYLAFAYLTYLDDLGLKRIGAQQRV